MKLVFACLQSNLIKNTVMLNRKRMLNLRALSEEKSIVVEMCRKKPQNSTPTTKWFYFLSTTPVREHFMLGLSHPVWFSLRMLKNITWKFPKKYSQTIRFIVFSWFLSRNRRNTERENSNHIEVKLKFPALPPHFL